MDKCEPVHAAAATAAGKNRFMGTLSVRHRLCGTTDDRQRTAETLCDALECGRNVHTLTGIYAHTCCSHLLCSHLLSDRVVAHSVRGARLQV